MTATCHLKGLTAHLDGVVSRNFGDEGTVRASQNVPAPTHPTKSAQTRTPSQNAMKLLIFAVVLVDLFLERRRNFRGGKTFKVSS